MKERLQYESGAPKFGPKLTVAPLKIESSATTFAKNTYKQIPVIL